jgi:hypothetical protein
MASKKAAKKAPAKKAAAKKAATTKSPAKKAVKTSAKKSTRYSPAASKQVETGLHEMHEGKLKIGRSDKKVTNPKQAIAIALSEARKKGARVPPNPNA